MIPSRADAVDPPRRLCAFPLRPPRRPRVVQIAAALLAFVSSTAGAQIPLPPDAALLVRADAAARHITTAPARFALRVTPAGDTLVDVFIRGPRGGAFEQDLRLAGARVGTRAGEWVTARVPLARLPALAAVRGVRAISVAGRAEFHLDSAIIDIRAPLVRDQLHGDQFEGATGRGAIVGLIDSGLDFSHPDFVEDRAGRSRVLWLWDQTLDGSGPGAIGGSTFDYGVECTRESMRPDAVSCPSRDEIGHGTHVAGIAGADGSFGRPGATLTFPGVAPNTEFIVVKTDLSLAAIVEAVDYIFRRAGQAGRPAVVNMSLGTNIGPHDGDEAVSLAIDALVGPGRIVVASTGNYGNNGNGRPEGVEPSLHAEVAPPPGSGAEITFRVSSYDPLAGSGNDFIAIQAFYAPDGRFRVTLTRPNGSVVVLDSGETITSADQDGAVVMYDGTQAGDSVLGVDLALGVFAPASPSRVVELFIGEWIAGAAPPAPGEWRIRFDRYPGSGSGRVDAYVVARSFFDMASFELNATNRMLIGSPGDARRAIAVAGYSTRASWLSFDGNHYALGDELWSPTGDLLKFSSPGPTRDGRQKPDIAAPGRVFSSFSRDAAGFPIQQIAADSAHLLLQGTSMAVPHVSGAVALLLSRDPTLDPERTRAALTAGARRDSFTAKTYAYGDAPGEPNFSWGAGKLDLPGAITQVPSGAGRGFIVALTPVDSVHRSRRGTLLPLTTVRLSAVDAESLSVATLAMRVAGNDPWARIALVIDADRDGVVDAGEPEVAGSEFIPLTAVAREFEFELPGTTLVIPAGGSVDVILAALLSGVTPNAASFSGEVLADRSVTRGMRSGALLTLEGAPAPLVAVRTTVLAANERVALSANPVRGTELVINFGEVARSIDVVDVTGRRVARLRPAAADRTVRWPLTDEAGRAVPNGVYVLLFDLDGGPIRRRIFVAR